FFRMVSRGELAKEAALGLMKWLAENPGKTIQEAVQALGLSPVDLGEVEAKIRELAEKYGDLLRSNPGKATSMIMGDLMKTYRGKVDGGKLYQMVSEIVREKSKNS
ncbi:MAG: Glu-tRNA(Gln) amidotransferase GatDE subunit E, partial [Aigarchaeota archaeon]|nr:Glu-tRNA(Gln) amidotransferase GatDE subunit E [Aigarchaeota archaeon]